MARPSEEEFHAQLRAEGIEIAMRELRITESGKAVIESGLTLRQAHEIKTGCSPEALCEECERYIAGPEQ